MLTALLRGELPQVQLFEREVDVGGELAGPDVRVRETLQVWEERRVKEGKHPQLERLQLFLQLSYSVITLLHTLHLYYDGVLGPL